MIGSDLNSLAVFITRVKTTPLLAGRFYSGEEWAEASANQISYRYTREAIADILDD